MKTALQIVTKDVMNLSSAKQTSSPDPSDHSTDPKFVLSASVGKSRKPKPRGPTPRMPVSHRYRFEALSHEDETPTKPSAEHSVTVPGEPFTTLLIGDSMIQNIQEKKLGKAAGHRVVVKSFSGATT